MARKNEKNQSENWFQAKVDELGAKQSLIARVAGVQRPFISEIYRGRKLPSARVLRAIRELERLREGR